MRFIIRPEGLEDSGICLKGTVVEWELVQLEKGFIRYNSLGFLIARDVERSGNMNRFGLGS